jgi:hypothetical protein
MKLFQTLALGASLAAIAPAALADKKSEVYVETQADSMLNVLNDTSLTVDDRKVKFQE